MSQSYLIAKHSNNYFNWQKTQDNNNYKVFQTVDVIGSNNKTYTIVPSFYLPIKSSKIYQVINNDNNKFIRKMEIVRSSNVTGLTLLKEGNNRKLLSELDKIPGFRILETENLNSIKLSNINKSLPKIESVCNIDILGKNIKLKLENIKYYNVGNFQNYPSIPFLEFNIPDNLKLDDLAGIIVKFKNRIVGIIDNVNLENNSLNVIPGFMVHKLIDDYLLNLKTSIYCLPIPYYLSREGLKIMKSNNLITSFNHKKVNNKGEVYNNQLKTYIPFDTHIAISYNNNEKISLGIKKGARQFLVRKNVKLLDDCLKVPAFNNDSFVSLNGFIFCELSQELIRWLYFSKNIKLNGLSMHTLMNNNFSKKGKKEVVLIDYKNKQNCNKKILDFIPFNDDNKLDTKEILKIVKINKQNINNLECLKKANLNQRKGRTELILANSSKKYFKIYV